MRSASGTEWAPAAHSPRLAEGVVDVWRADLDGPGASYADLLSDDERARAARIIRPGHGRRWAAARGILRALLAGYVGGDPRTLRFELGPYGKPALAGQDADVRFNVSHAGGAALYALAAGREVGVDVEHEDRRVDAVRVARRIFGAEEAARLSALEPAARTREFLRAWVRYEATVKCLGTGIGAFDRPDLAPNPPAVTELAVGPRTLGAVAVAIAAVELRCWTWPAGRPS
ncbi:MAG TPA: 4'-phosphopantetheinyl transferase superfamily protein [Solirubrobacteraceae bacterium]|nr:4'-phosphopantetheinyl transferase superfamily protein [Solirubrobacteraceae bacterium]